MTEPDTAEPSAEERAYLYIRAQILNGEFRPGSRLPEETVAELKRRGHKVEVGPDWSEGRLTAAAQEGPHRKAAANARGMQGYAAGR